MSGRGVIALPVLLVLAASCAGVTTRAQSGNVKPKAGPPSSIYVNYSGGLLDRRVSTTFSVERDAYVLVGHLGGNGEITVLYPESPESAGRVEAGARLRTLPFDASHDAMPGLMSHVYTSHRLSGALMDSYDGRGYGYVFIVSSDRRLDFDRVSRDGRWSELVVDNFYGSADPRVAVRDFAELLAGSQGYSLRFASGLQTQHVHAYASSASSCSMLYAYDSGLRSSWLYHSFRAPWNSYYNVHGPQNYYWDCGMGNWLMYDFYGYRYGYRYGWYDRRQILHPTPRRQLSVPTVATTPVVTRDGRRPLGDNTLTLDRRALLPGATPAPRARIADLPGRDRGTRPARNSDDSADRAVPVRSARPVDRRRTDESTEHPTRTEPRRSEPTRTSRPTERRATPRPATTQPDRARPSDKRTTPKPKPDHQ